MSYEITGKLIVKNDIQQISETFKKREFVLEITESVAGREYVNYAKMQLVQNRCELIDPYQEGDMLRVQFNIRGNRWEKEGRENYFTNLEAWRIEAANPIDPYAQGGTSSSYSTASPSAPESGTSSPADSSSGPGSADAEDDLPF